MPKDYYNILGVQKGASKDELKKAFRKKAHEHHPDKGGDEAKFKEVNEAYQVLSDDTKRQQYDQFGQTFDGAGGFPGGGAGFGGFPGGVNFEDLGDIFGDFFGGGRSRSRAPRGQDVMMDVEISFKESVFGVQKELSLTKNNSCERCGGVGAEPGTAMKTCSDCDGAGIRVTVQRTILGNIQQRVACETCHGNGEVPEMPCSTCSGTGTEYGRKTMRVDIPAGIENGMKIRIRGEGESIGGAGQSGDLFLRVHVKRDPRFERDGNTIYTKKDIGFTQASLGDEVEVETVDGRVTLKVPAGTQSGDKLRLKGKGISTGRGRGDQIVIVNVVTPKKLTRKQKKLMEELGLYE